MKKTVTLVRRLVLVLVSIIFIWSAYEKFVPNDMTISMFNAMHLESFRVALGVIELVITAALWWRPTRTVGVLIASAYLGGAIAETFSAGMLPVFPAVILLALWVLKKLSWYECHNCTEKGHCHCPCDGCKDCTAAEPMTK